MTKVIHLSLSGTLARLMQENLAARRQLVEAEERREKALDSVLLDVLGVLDTFERAEQIIAERHLADTDEAQKGVKRLLNAKKKVSAMLAKYDVRPTATLGAVATDADCSTVDTEPDAGKLDGAIISIEKQGYRRGDRRLRPAEVVVVKN